MDKETYEALKRILKDERIDRIFRAGGSFRKDVQQLEGWLDEVAKEYTEENYEDRKIQQGELEHEIRKETKCEGEDCENCEFNCKN